MEPSTPITYIYGLIDPRTNRLRYVGKANDVNERMRSHIRDSRRRNTPMYAWLRSLFSKGLLPIIECMLIVPESLWEEAERSMIANARKAYPDLLNLADGGGQPKTNAAAQRKLGATLAKRRDKRLWKLKLNLGQALQRGVVSPYVKAVMRQAARKRPDLFGEWIDV